LAIEVVRREFAHTPVSAVAENLVLKVIKSTKLLTNEEALLLICLTKNFCTGMPRREVDQISRAGIKIVQAAFYFTFFLITFRLPDGLFIQFI
jgi:hypothetical protein